MEAHQQFNDGDWEWFLNHPEISLFNKSFWVFYRLALKVPDMRNNLTLDIYKPWHNSDVYESWSYQVGYGLEIGLSVQDSACLWRHFMDHWNKEFLHNDAMEIQDVFLTEGIQDIGVFTKLSITLDSISKKAHGYLDEISPALFEELKRRGFLSMYCTNELSENSNDTSVGRHCRYWILFGILACVNSDRSLQIYFAHRNMFGWSSEPLMWKLCFSKSSHHFIGDGIIVAMEVSTNVNVTEFQVNDDSFDSTEVTYNHYAEPNEITGLQDFTRFSYICRVMFGGWRRGEMINYCYNTNQQVLINYDF